MNEEIKSPLLTESEAAKYLRVSARSLFTLRKERKVAPTPVGRKVFYTKADLDAYLDRQRQTVINAP